MERPKLAALESPRRHVVVMTCPIVPGMKPEHTLVLASRNMELEKLVGWTQRKSLCSIFRYS